MITSTRISRVSILACLIVITLFSSNSIATYAQCGAVDCVSPRPLPRMWVSDFNANDLKSWYTSGMLSTSRKTKEQILKDAISQNHQRSYFFTTSCIDNLFSMIEDDYDLSVMKGIRLYIVSYDGKKPANLPAVGIDRNELLFVFAPTKHCDSLDLGNYYVLWGDGNPYRVDYLSVTGWENNYLTQEVETAQGLNSTIEPNQDENLMPGPNLHYDDTRAIFYSYSDFKDFFCTERKYQDCNRYNNPQMKIINGIFITLASVTDKGIGHNYNNMKETGFKSRLIVFYDFSRLNGAQNEIFSIEQTRDFAYRPKPLIDNKCYCHILPKHASDNGQLCPPNCPCPNPPCR